MAPISRFITETAPVVVSCSASFSISSAASFMFTPTQAPMSQ